MSPIERICGGFCAGLKQSLKPLFRAISVQYQVYVEVHFLARLFRTGLRSPFELSWSHRQLVDAETTTLLQENFTSILASPVNKSPPAIRLRRKTRQNRWPNRDVQRKARNSDQRS
jgi:hypothetical protein